MLIDFLCCFCGIFFELFLSCLTHFVLFSIFTLLTLALQALNVSSFFGILEITWQLLGYLKSVIDVVSLLLQNLDVSYTI